MSDILAPTLLAISEALRREAYRRAPELRPPSEERTVKASKAPGPPQDWVTIGKAARLLSVSRTTLWRRIAAGEIPPEHVRCFGPQQWHQISAAWIASHQETGI